jgi:hypothetical protein
MVASSRLRSLLCATLLGVSGVASAAAQSAPVSDASATQAASGVSLPTSGLVWILDSAASTPQLTRLSVRSAISNQHRADNLARSSAFLASFSTWEIPGRFAPTRIDAGIPVLFVGKTTDEQEADDSRSAGNSPVSQYHIVLLRLKTVGQDRQVFGYAQNQLTIKLTLKTDEIAVRTEEIAGGQWRKITPQEPLANGEYAITFMDTTRTLISGDVYDFGVGPAVPVKKP